MHEQKKMNLIKKIAKKYLTYKIFLSFTKIASFLISVGILGLSFGAIYENHISKISKKISETTNKNIDSILIEIEKQNDNPKEIGNN